MRSLGALQVQNCQLSDPSSKALDAAIEYSRCAPINAQYSARDTTRFVPDLEPEFAGSDFERIFTGRQCNRLFAVFQSSRPPAKAHKAGNRGQHVFRICPRPIFGTAFSCAGSYHGVLPLDELTFESRLQAVEARITSAVERSGRTRSDITLVAVSKKFSAERIREAYRAGVRVFGENYIQEFAEKRPQLGEMDARFHLIGHLQSNKSRQACDLFDVIQTVDSTRLLRRLDAAAAERQRTLEVLLEIKLSSEENKSGAPPDQISDLLSAAMTCPQVKLSGLMTMPPWSENQEQSRPYFQELARLARQYGLPQLSMGMSNDFEAAIEEGATIIRVGTALFGARPKPQTSRASQL